MNDGDNDDDDEDWMKTTASALFFNHWPNLTTPQPHALTELRCVPKVCIR